MTQDEVDLIYKYLHENYEYKDGQFLHKNKNIFLTGFCLTSGRMRATLHINKKNYYIRYASLVWIYHKKETYYSFDFKDNNPTNNKIENLIPLTTITHSFNKRKTSKGYTEVTLQNNVKKYRVDIFMGNQSHNFGTFDQKKEAINSYNNAKKLWIEQSLDPKEIKKILIKEGIIKVREKQIKIIKPKKGYVFDKRDKKYYAYITINNKKIGLGRFLTAEDAHQAYLKAKEDYERTKTLSATSS